MSPEDRMLAAFLKLAIADRPELAALQPQEPKPLLVPARPASLPPRRFDPLSLPGDRRPRAPQKVLPDDMPRQNLPAMVAELQVAAPDREREDEGWDQARLRWPDDWFTRHDPGDAAACRRMWASSLLLCIRDSLREFQERSATNRRLGRPVGNPTWIGTSDFNECCALAGLDGEAVRDSLAATGFDAQRFESLMYKGDQKIGSKERADRDE